MIWALLAAYLTKRSPWVQALVFGLCTGLFVATSAEANQREPLISTELVLVLVAGGIAGAVFYLALNAQRRHDWKAGTPTPIWVHRAYATVWVLSLAAALAALVGAGGLKVAALAIVPIVLLAPPAIDGIRVLLRRPRASETGVPPDRDPVADDTS